MVNRGTKNSDRLSDKQLRKMIDYFGEDRLPDPLLYPLSFNFYVKMFLYLRKSSESQYGDESKKRPKIG